MNDYNINNLVHVIKSTSAPVVLYGAGVLGKFSQHALKTLDIQVDYFCDSDEQKWGKLHCGVKIISPKELAKLSRDVHIFISTNYITSVLSRLQEVSFVNIYDCMVLFENTDFSIADLDMHPLDIQKLIALYKRVCLKIKNTSTNVLNLNIVDIVVTEKCSLKCRDCANLMQYYAQPKHCNLDLLLKSVDKLMECVDSLYEFRVLGGETFMHKEVHKIINQLLIYDNADKVIVFSNGTIVPKGENLSCLKNSKVTVEITDYGNLSKKRDELIEILKANDIAYIMKPVSYWTDSGCIEYHHRTTTEMTRMFRDCCVSDVITLLHGKLYRCPFSAHATNLKAIPFSEDDIIDLSEESSIMKHLKVKIKRFYNNKLFISACYYCNGRDYTCAKVTPAVQINDKLPLNIFGSRHSPPLKKKHV